jgi:hypothetical protein
VFNAAFDLVEEEALGAFFNGITAWIGEQYGHVMLDEVRSEFWLMVNGQQRWRAA